MENKLVKYLNELRKKAVDSHPKKLLEERYSCYAKGGVDDSAKEGDPKRTSTNNVLKSIVDTISTFVLDNHLTKEVVLRSMSFSDASNLEMANDKAAVLNDCLQDVIDQNSDKRFQKDFLLSLLIYGVGISKAYWSQNSEEDLGEVKYETCNPTYFYPDPSATDIESCNYIFIKRQQSVFELVQKYKDNPEILAKVKKLNPEGSGNSKGYDIDRSENILSTQNDAGTSVSYMDGDYDSKYKKSTKNLTIWEVYLKDDTVFVDPEGEGNEELQEQRFIYPNGRVITYCNKTILEDKAIDYPFGFPFDIVKANFSPNEFFGPSLVSYLRYPQERLDNLNAKIKTLISKDINATLLPPSLGLTPEDFACPTPILAIDNVASSRGETPINYKNSNLMDLPALEARAAVLEQDMYNVARVNKMMISGERPVGVNSGRMVEDLIESPMSSIREIQRQMVDLNIKVSNKIVTLIQLYYKAQRIVRLATGDFISIRPEVMENADQQTMVSIQKAMVNQNKVSEISIDIKTDLSSGEFETKIVAGSEMPLSRTQLAQLTLKFGSEGFFNPVDIDTKEFILEKIDYPNYRAVIEKMRDAQQKQQAAMEEAKQDPSKKFLMELEEAEIKPKEFLTTINNIQDETIKSEMTLQLLSYFGFSLTPPLAPATFTPEEQSLAVQGDSQPPITVQF